jgi:FhuF 2Fe-2S C-terminal domain
VTEGAAALAAAAAHGPYFATDPVPGPGWLRLSEVDAVLPDRVAATQAALGAAEWRVAASVTHLGLCARLVAPLVAVAVTHGLVIDAMAYWQPLLGGPCPLSFPDPIVVRPHPTDLPAALATSLVAATAPVSTATARLAKLPPALLRGNLAAGVAGAVAQLGRGSDVMPALLRTPPFAGTGTVTTGRFVRRSCCLIYRAGTGTCGDCPLRPPGDRATI